MSDDERDPGEIVGELAQRSQNFLSARMACAQAIARKADAAEMRRLGFQLDRKLRGLIHLARTIELIGDPPSEVPQPTAGLVS
jgi:hypothetical protein